MRAAIIILLLLLGLGGVFYFFVLSTPADVFVEDLVPKSTTQKIVPTTIPSLDSQVPIGRSAGVWAETLDPKTGAVINRFTSEDVVPRPDGSVDVVKPQANFYGRNGGVVKLDGSTGHVFYTQAGSRQDSKSLGTSTPTSGDLKDVTIRFYENVDDAEPMMTATVPAVRFDANSNRISTIDSVVNGQGVAAEQVPVKVRGRDFDFDGQGLSVAWNDREGMLDQLEILRGDRLFVRDISKFTGGELVSRPASVSAPVARVPSVAASLFGIIAVAAPEAPVNDKDLYHATFDEDVRVLKGGQEVAIGSVMRCVIPLGRSAKPRESTSQAADRSADSREQRDRARRKKDETATTRTNSDNAPATTPATQPVPMEIRWTGKLTIRPVRLVQDAPRTAMVELQGSPARVSEGGASAVGRLIHIQPEAGRVRIEPGGTIRAIEIKDVSGAEIRSRSPLVIDQPAGYATIDGGGALSVPPSERQQSALQMTWSKKLSISLAKGELAFLQKIDVEGEASVNSEQLKLNCERLELGFDGPAAAPASSSKFAMPSPDLTLLRVVHASGKASCVVGAADAQRTLAAGDIQLGFVAGEQDALLNSILCDGEVKLTDANGLNLDAGNLSVQTQPLSLAKPQSELGDDFFAIVTGFSAQRDVHIRRPDGTSVTGEQVELTGRGVDQRLFVTGAPAHVASPKGALKAQDIELDPATGDITVPGAGQFVGANPDQPGTSIAIAWIESMTVVGKTGLCTLKGGVHIDGTDEEGSRLIADARRGTIQFEAKPTSSTQPAESGLAGVTVESIQSLDLDGGVALSVDSADQRSSSLETDRLRIHLADGTIDAPQSGRMLVIDRRKDEATGKSKFGPGALALQWADTLRWDMAAGNLHLLGGVRVGFEREGEKDPVRITCDRLSGTLTPLDTTQGFDQITPRVDLKSLRAEGNVTVRSREASFDAAELVYDLSTQLATASGTPARPVEVVNSKGTSRIGFSSIVWNLETGRIDDFRDLTGQIRQ